MVGAMQGYSMCAMQGYSLYAHTRTHMIGKAMNDQPTSQPTNQLVISQLTYYGPPSPPPPLACSPPPPQASILVALGAVMGCANSEFGGLLGQSRIFVTMSRAGLLPKPLVRGKGGQAVASLSR